MIPFTRREDGIHLTLSAGERSVLSDLTGQLRQILVGDVLGDPVSTRLFPDAYPEDSDASQEFRRYTFHDLLEAKSANVAIVHEWLTGVRDGAFDGESEQAWLRSLTDLRLVIAQRLGIVDNESLDAAMTTRTDAAVVLRDLYDWLGFVQEHLVQMMSNY